MSGASLITSNTTLYLMENLEVFAISLFYIGALYIYLYIAVTIRKQLLDLQFGFDKAGDKRQL